jgi:hypothetical protein
MSLQTSASAANPLTINELKTEFTGPTPSKLTNYYKGGGYVPPHTCNASAPTSGRINLLNFLGGDIVFRCALTEGGTNPHGYSDGTDTTAIGTRSGNSSVGLSRSSTVAGTMSGWWVNDVNPPKGGSTIYRLNLIIASTTDFSSGATYPWVSAGINGDLYTRVSSTSVTFFTTYTQWVWQGLTVSPTLAGNFVINI